MKVRIKFSKMGSVKFIGHLDTMRYFQKAVRRADLPAAFSGGYSPHMIMSFASPLGVGTESMGEYFDLELKEDVPEEDILERLNAVMAEGFHVEIVSRAPEGKAGNAMAAVAAADYGIRFREGKAPADGWQDRVDAFLSQGEIMITKTTKTGEKEVDIRPFIYEMRTEGDGLFCRLASASSNYTKPEAVMNAFFFFLGEEMKPFACMYTRLELYTDLGEDKDVRFLPLYRMAGV